jgi:hypothetical protein
MKTKMAILVAGVFVLLGRVPIVAHHSFSAEFDASAPIRLTGTVTQIKWSNPHTYLYLDVKDGTRNAVNWRFEMAGATSLLHQGLTPSLMRVGDVVIVEGWRAKDGTNFGNARSVRRGASRRLFAGSSQGAQPKTQACLTSLCGGSGTPPTTCHTFGGVC